MKEKEKVLLHMLLKKKVKKKVVLAIFRADADAFTEANKAEKKERIH